MRPCPQPSLGALARSQADARRRSEQARATAAEHATVRSALTAAPHGLVPHALAPGVGVLASPDLLASDGEFQTGSLQIAQLTSEF
jgi:hypothetical protein